MIDLKNEGNDNIANNGYIIGGDCIMFHKVNIVIEDKGHNVYEGLGDRLYKAMKANNLSAYKLEQRLGISRWLICDYIDGKADPSLKNIAKLANYLGVTLDWLVFGTSNKSNSDDLSGLKKTIEELERLVKVKKLMDY